MTNRQKNHLVMYIYIKSKSNDFPNIIQKETYRHAGYLRGFGLFLFFGVVLLKISKGISNENHAVLEFN